MHSSCGFSRNHKPEQKKVGSSEIRGTDLERLGNHLLGIAMLRKLTRTANVTTAVAVELAAPFLSCSFPLR